MSASTLFLYVCVWMDRLWEGHMYIVNRRWSQCRCVGYEGVYRYHCKMLWTVLFGPTTSFLVASASIRAVHSGTCRGSRCLRALTLVGNTSKERRGVITRGQFLSSRVVEQ